LTGCQQRCGTVFKITPQGALTTLRDFDSTDGAYPAAGLIQATDGSFYGTTAGGVGTLFKITPGGTLTTLYSFDWTDGAEPYAGLVQATNGDLYGTTVYGGPSNPLCGPNPAGCGTVFKISPSGALTTLYAFCSQSGCTDGVYPWAGMVQGADGNFYGTTVNGGAYGGGSVFKVTPEGALTTLYSFCSLPECADGGNPYAGLVQSDDGNFYGITVSTIFKITPEGALTTLYKFCQGGLPCVNGSGPTAGLVQATDGSFYGTTQSGGASSTGSSAGYGTVFEITPGGRLTTLHSFDLGDGGYQPVGGLLQATDGSFYGTTWAGGTGDLGTVFKLDLGLRPFVKTLPTSGTVGAPVRILGSDLTGATSVSFNGVAAEFTVNSTGTTISTTVPAGATTGKVQVTTPNGTLLSNAIFQVTP
jgi:uncharacterized repeat protein (TIGR03803 family)